MADALKRITAARDNDFKDRVSFYMWQQANAVLDNATPNADDLDLAKAILARQVNAEDMAMVAITNATIGAAIDAGTVPPDSDIEYVVMTENKFHDLATAYKSAGVIGV
jgi:hypothetical protein